MIQLCPKPTNTSRILDRQETLFFVHSDKMPIINRSNDFIFYHELFDLKKEIALAFLFDRNQHPIGYAIAPSGSFDFINFSARELVKISLSNNATSMILVHHHPSGNFHPSFSDIKMTKHLNNILKTINIILSDHKIYSEHGFFSFKANGLI